MIIAAALAIADVCSALKEPTAAEEAAVDLAAEVRRMRELRDVEGLIAERDQLRDAMQSLEAKVASQRATIRTMSTNEGKLHAHIADLETKLVVSDLQVATIKEQLRLAEAKRDQRLTACEELTPLVLHLLSVLELNIIDLPFDAQTELDLAMLAVRTKIG